MKILAISGSLRAVSYNSAALRAARRLAPRNIAIHIYDEVGRLPPFNPDDDIPPLPVPVDALRRLVGAADALVFACPEYAGGIPGAFKNLLDWLVSGDEFPDKPIALFNCSQRASLAQAALKLVLATMSGRVIADASIMLPLLGTSYGEDDIVADPAMAATIIAALDKLAAVA